MPASEILCPNNVCWTQVGDWNPATNDAAQISCEVEPSCLAITCGSSAITANLNYDLFDEQNVGAANVKAALVAGERNFSLDCEDSEYSFNFDNDDYAVVTFNLGSACLSAQVSANEEQLTYSFEVSLNDADSTHVGLDQTPKLEFHVDTNITGDCVYPLIVTIDNNFWVNQEDVAAYNSADGDFSELFQCNFEALGQALDGNSIVNMGDTINGELVSSTAIPDLSYKLTGLVVSEPGNDELTFDVFANQAAVSGDFDDQGDGTATGTNYDFSWMSFGFEGNTDQNQLNVQCQVQLVYTGEQ